MRPEYGGNCSVHEIVYDPKQDDFEVIELIHGEPRGGRCYLSDSRENNFEFYRGETFSLSISEAKLN